MLGNQALSGLDNVLFEPSQHEIEGQTALQALFKDMTLEVEGARAYQFVFRFSRRLRPNAFALPSGIVVMNDTLVNLSQDDNELIAVLAHEMGHLKQRHQLRRLLQSSATGLLLVAVTGGLSSVASLGAWLPMLLVDSKYSRSLDSEADDFSLAFLTSHNIPHTALANILSTYGEKYGTAGQLPDYLSSHPATQE